MLRRIFMLLAAASLLGFGITSDGFVYGHGGGGGAGGGGVGHGGGAGAGHGGYGGSGHGGYGGSGHGGYGGSGHGGYGGAGHGGYGGYGHGGYGGDKLRKGAKLIEVDLPTGKYTATTIFGDGSKQFGWRRSLLGQEACHA